MTGIADRRGTLIVRTYFSIVSMGRSGSTFLQRLLDSHPEICCLGEMISKHAPYGKLSGVPVKTYVENTLFGTQQGVLGFKMPWDHILDYPEVFGVFRDLGFRLIFLKRVNKLDQFISMKLAQQTGVWDSSATYPEQSVDASFEELYRFMVTSTHVDYFLEQMCKTFPCISVTYEDLVAGKGYTELQDFLGVAHHPLRPQTVRSRTLPRRKALKNYDQLVKRFAGTAFSAFFTAEEFLGG